MFTVLFALADGWVAQWNEMVEDPSQASGARAAYRQAKRDYIDIAKRYLAELMNG